MPQTTQIYQKYIFEFFVFAIFGFFKKIIKN
jgi:hypothetical protein